MACWVLGWKEDFLTETFNGDQETIWNAKQKAIHGASENYGGTRISFSSGLKHSVCNKVYLSRGQNECYDKNPCIVIIPIMTLDQVKNWDIDDINRDGVYEAVVMADSWGVFDIESVCDMTGLKPSADAQEAIAEEIEIARELLEQVVSGMAHSLMTNDRPQLPEVDVSKVLLRKLREKMTNVEGGITVPDVNIGNFRVRKVRFGGAERHPPPDPLLLAGKAAIVWSTRCGQRLLADGGEVCDDDNEDDRDSLSVAAEDHYIELLQQSYRPKSRTDLAVGLGQPNGYGGESTTNRQAGVVMHGKVN